MRLNQHNSDHKVSEHETSPRFVPRGGGLHQRIWFGLLNWFLFNLAKEVRLAEPLVWLTCIFMFGISLYFAAPNEPHVLSLILFFVGAATLLWRWRTGGLKFYVMGTICSLLGGFLVAALHTSWADPSIVERKHNVSLEGTIAVYEKRADGSKRMEINDLHMRDDHEGLALPNRIRVRVLAKDFSANPGDRLAFRAQIGPPPGPVIPRGYDFARDMFFKKIGATGFVYGTPEIVSPTRTTSQLFNYPTERWRAAISSRISQAFIANGQEQFQGVAAALLVGEKGNIDPDIREVFVTAGLAYLLAISGLHMALVVTFIIFSARGLLALSPTVSINYPIRNIAIYVGLATGGAYFLLSGGSVSATRAFIMVSIMALALLFGRRALSIRNIALACLMILLISPFALMGPGFQMSFAATLCLVAFASYWIGRPTQSNENISFSRWIFTNFKRYLLGLIITSLLAGVSTGLFAAFHFHRVAPLGLATNLLGVPIFSILVMPFGFLSLLLMPFGYETLPFMVMGYGIDILVRIAELISAHTSSFATTGMLNHQAFLLLSAAIILLCIMKSSLRVLLVPFFALGAWMLPVVLLPHILIAEDGKTVAVRTSDNALVVSGKRAGRFEQKVWRAALGFNGEHMGNRTASQPSCDVFGCVFQFYGKTIAHVKHPSGFYEDCRRADIVISELSAPKFCGDKALIIDRHHLKSGGSHSVVIDQDNSLDNGFIVKSAIPAIKRPWHDHYQLKSR